jgi:putative tricarboxylic transport membrane protein
MSVLIAGVAVPVQSAPPEWKPEKNVELIVASGAGGGLDQTARTIQKIWQDQKLLSASGIVVNKPGGSGAIGYTYLRQFSGDGHYLAVTSPTLLTNHIVGRTPMNYTDFTAIAQLMSEYLVIYARVDSPLKDGKDVIQKLQRDPGALSVAVGSVVGGTAHIGVATVLKAAGVDIRKLKTVAFKSGAENVTALLGGHVDLAVGPAGQAVPQLGAGKVRIIGITAPQRLGGALAAAPTWKEQGIDIVVDTWRGIMGPSGLGPSQVAFWDAVFSRLVREEEWRAVVEKNVWGNTYRNSAATRKMLDAEYAQLKDILTDLGLAK